MNADPLESALAEGWITDVVRTVKSGKEATVYLCRGGARSGEELVAAKVYRSRHDRAFKDDSAYWDGAMRDMGRRVRLAATKRTAFGREVRFSRWLGREYEHLSTLQGTGARVPRPIAQVDGLVVLSWVGSGEEAAPQLRQADLAEPAGVFDQLLQQVELFLACNLVHGDLSEYNVLIQAGEPVVIDFPQAVDPRFNRAARDLLRRDVTNLSRHFARRGVLRDSVLLADALWARWLRSELAAPGAEIDPALAWVDSRATT